MTTSLASRGRLLWSAVGLALAWLLCGPARAADPAGAAEAVTQLRDVFHHITAAINAFAAGNAELVAIGKRTTVTLFGVLLVWGFIRSWILGKSMAQLLPEFIQPLVIFGLAFWSVDHLGPTVMASVASLGQVFSSTLFQTSGPPTEADILDRLAAASFEIVTASPNASGSWINVPSLVAHEALGFLYRLVTAVVLMLAGIIAAGVMMVAKVQTALAILFAPVMIPWAMWQPSAFLFNAWLGFLIGGAMQGVMSLAVASLSAQVVDKVAEVTRSMNGSDGMSFVTCCVALLMGFLIAFLFLKVPSLASGMVGGASLNLEGWRAVTQGIGRGFSVAGQAGQTVAAAGYRFGEGAWQGYGGAQGSGPGGAARAASGASLNRARGLSGSLGQRLGSAAAGASGRRQAGDSPGFPSAASPQPAPERATAKPAHKPFRPSPSARPVNRPVERAP